MPELHDPTKNFSFTEISEKEILACLPDGLIVLNAEGFIVWMNQAARKLLDADLIGSCWRAVIQQVFSPREDDGHEVSLVNGRRVHVAISSLDTLPGELVILTDLTTTRDYEQAKEIQKQLLSLGRMTAQLAHQIRTPLSSARLYTDHLASIGLTDERHRLWLSRVQTCHVSIEHLIDELLHFVRGEPLEKKLINLTGWGKILEEKIHTLIEGAEVDVTINNKLPSQAFLLHEESLISAILNLINNSIQAEADRILIDMLPDKSSQGLILTIKDNGCGMSLEVKKQALSPFFTTRAQGTGLGLAVVNAVIKAHDGELNLESFPGQGCCITIRIPKQNQEKINGESIEAGNVLCHVNSSAELL